jgi:hypothetical protein
MKERGHDPVLQSMSVAVNLMERQEEQVLAGHLVSLDDGAWALWRWIGLRGAGFPATDVLKLAAPECGAAADALLRAEVKAQQTLEALLELVNHALDGLQREGAWEDQAQRAPLVKTLRHLKKGKLPTTLGLAPAQEAMLEAARVFRAEVEAASSLFHSEFNSAIARLSQSTYELASNERFREAVIWQNRRAFHTGIASLTRVPPGSLKRNSMRRQHEELVANYIQRYCTKNDTIGFFGPVGWARFLDRVKGIEARPGENLLAERNVYFEGWCIDTLMKTLGKKKALHQWLAPRRMPTIHLEGTTLYSPPQPPVQISEKEAVLLRACDAERTAHEIAAGLLRTAPLHFKSEEAVYSLLESMCGRGLISCSLEASIELHPEATLRRHLERIGDEALRLSTLSVLDELEGAREEVAQAAGDASRLDESLGRVEECFTRLTGAAPTRSAGELYAGRTLVYEDCRRDLEIEFGPEVLKALSGPLSLMLTSARWLSYEVAKVYRKAFAKIYAELARKGRSPTVELVDFWAQARNLILDKQRPVDEPQREFQRRWAELLSHSTEQRRADFSSEQLRPRALAAFQSPAAGWWSARYHSPDVMIAASSVEAIRRGDFQFVLGEMHLATNTLGASLFMAQHPSPEDFFQALERDMPETHLVPMLTKYVGPEGTARVFLALVSPRDFYLEIAPDSDNNIPRSQVLPIAELVIENRNGTLITRTRDGRLQFDVMEACGLMLSTLIVDSFKILATGTHAPRITIDSLVVSRESWSFSPKALGFAFIEDEAERFLAARRWRRQHDLPRALFVKVPVEKKPFYLNLDSPVYLSIFSKMVRRSAEQGAPDGVINLTEMLPTFDQVWLPDGQGQRYTSELRLVAVDRSP